MTHDKSLYISFDTPLTIALVQQLAGKAFTVPNVMLVKSQCINHSVVQDTIFKTVSCILKILFETIPEC